MTPRQTPRPPVLAERRVRARRTDDPPEACARCTRIAAARKRQTEAEAASRNKDDLIAIVSHELRTPLTAIAGWSRLLAAETLDPPAAVKALATIERNSVILNRLITDLLDLHGIATGRVCLELAPVDLGEIVAEVRTMIEPAAEAKRVDVAVELHGELPPVLGDGLRLRQVAWNLMTNAVKFAPERGHVVVRLGIGNDRDVVVTVADDGPGVPDVFLPHVFERFRQANRGDNGRGGVGLGLYIVKQLVEAHGGTVVAEQTSGQGAAFTVRLPVAARRKASRPPAGVVGARYRTGGASSIHGVHALVVGPDLPVRRAAVAALQAHGAEVMVEALDEAALVVVQRERPHVIVKDVSGPCEEGYTFVRDVRALARTAGGGTPVVALNGEWSSRERERAFDAGFQAYLLEPLDAEELAAVVECVTRRACSDPAPSGASP